MKLIARQRILMLLLQEHIGREIIEICDILQIPRGTAGPIIADLMNQGILIKYPIRRKFHGDGSKFYYSLPGRSVEKAIKEVGQVYDFSYI